MNAGDKVMDAATLDDAGGVGETHRTEALVGALGSHSRRAIEKGLYPPIFYALLHWFPFLGTTLTLSMINDRPQGKALLERRLGSHAIVLAFIVEVFYLWVWAIFIFPPILLAEIVVKLWLSKVFYETVAATRP